MRKIFQNFDLVSIPVLPGVASVYFPEDALFTDKTISQMIFFSSDENLKDPVGLDVVPPAFLDYCYLNLCRENKQLAVQNLSCSLLRPACNLDIRLNGEIDFTMSEIKIMNHALLDKTHSVLIGVEYQTRYKDPFVEPTQTTLLNIPLSSGKTVYKLSDFGAYELAEKKIKRMTTHGNTDCFLILREKSGKVYNQLPLSLFIPFLNSENSYFDNISIDFDNSLIETLNNSSDVQLTFFY